MSAGFSWQVPGSYHYPSNIQIDEGEPPALDEYDADAAPDLVGEVLGWRSWRVTPQGDLISANGHSVWRPGVNRAVCGGIDGEHDHPAPQEGCTCGFYGYHGLHGQPKGEEDVTGGIFRAWGKIIVHPTGLRSEWAEIVCLVSSEPSAKVKRASGYYDVPIFPDAEKALAYAREQGHDVIPEDLRPEPQKEMVDVTMWQASPPSYISSGHSHFATGGAVTIPSTFSTAKSLPKAAFWVSWLIGWLFWGAAWLVGKELFLVALAIFTLSVLELPIYRLALRLRCRWREEARDGDHPRILHQHWTWCRDNRRREGLEKGDRCPECGWRLRREKP